MDWITRNIALGDNIDGMEPVGCDVVLNVAAEDIIDHDLDHLHVKIEDREAIPHWQLDQAVRYLRDNVRAGKLVLVHCIGGVSRSPSVLAAYLALEEGTDADAALERIQRVRKEAHPDPAVWESVVEYVEAKRRGV